MVPVKGDGHCAFRCFSKAFYESEDNHFDLRCLAVGYVSASAELQAGFALFDPEAYRRAMLQHDASKSSAWGDNPEIVALAKLFNINVFVIQDTHLPF